MQSILTVCLNWVKDGGEGGVGEREIVMVSCFLTLEITLHRMNFASLLFSTLYLPSKYVQMPPVSSSFLSEKSENEISCFTVTPSMMTPLYLLHKHTS